MKVRPIASLGLLLACVALLTSAAKPPAARGSKAPGTAASRAHASLEADTALTPPPLPKQKLYINSVLDSGQFLPDTALLGHVNGKPITAGDFVQTYYNSYAPDRPAGDSLGRVEWLNSMVNKEILGTLARRANRPLAFEDRATMREYSERVLSNVLFTRAVVDSVKVSDRQVYAVWKREFPVEHHLRHIMLPDRSPALEVLARLRSGMSWSEAVKRYSLATQDRARDGDLGWVARLSLNWQMADSIYRMQPGQISGPLPDRDGYHIVQLVERRNTDPPVYESVAKAIRSQLTSREASWRAEKLLDAIRAEIGMQYDTAAITRVCARFKPNMTTGRGAAGEPDIAIHMGLPSFTAADTGTVLARYRDGVLTLRRLVVEYSEMSPMTRPSVNTFDGMRDEIDEIVLQPYRARIAEQRGLEKDPLAVALIERKREGLLVNHLYQDSIESKITVTPAEQRKYYDQHVAQFVTYPTAHYGALIADDSAGAAKLADRLRGGEKLEDILRADSLAGRRKTGYIRDETEAMGGQFHQLLFEEMKPGQIRLSGPDRNGRWVAIQLLSFDSGHQLPFDQARGYADEQVRAIKAEELLKRLLARHRKDFRIQIHPELVMRIRLVDPAAAGHS